MSEEKTTLDTQKNQNEMSKLLEDKQYFNLPQVGELIKGKVLSANKSEVHLDLGGVATGLVRGKECYGESEEYRNLKPGDEVEATVLEEENENGEVELSFRYAGKQKAWQEIYDSMEEGKIIPITIIEANKGGLLVKLNTVAGFLPVSQLSPEHYPRVPGGDKNHILEILKSYIGKTFEVKVLDANEEDEKLIVSEKTAWEETQKGVMEQYKPGMTIEGTVTAITDFGVFIEFDNKMEGLVHISEIAWQRIDDPRDFVKVGQKVKSEIIGIEGSKIFLSMKKLITDPWKDVEKKYKIGEKVKGKIIKTNPFGLFVELDEEIHGLAHISQLSDKPIEDVKEIAKPGDEMDFYVVSIEPKKHRLGLSLTKPKKADKPKPINDDTNDKKEIKQTTKANDKESKTTKKEKTESKETTEKTKNKEEKSESKEK